MKRLTALLTVCLLAVLLVLPVSAAPQVDAWAQPAVSFALENSLVSEADLRPKANATRAELAGMVVNLLQVQKGADLQRFTDVSPSDWYYDVMSKAVAIGVYEGDGTTLTPRKQLTREQAMVVLARCFGVLDGDTASLETFSDYAAVSDWAVGSVAGMVDEGYVRGSGGSLHPQDPISRQELMQLIYNLAGTVIRNGEVPSEGNAVLLSGEGEISNIRVHGDLILGCSAQEKIVLRNVSVDGRLVIHSSNVEIIGGRADQIVCGGQNVVLKTDGDSDIFVASGTAIISGGGGVTAAATATLQDGRYDSVVLDGATVTVDKGARVSNAELIGKDSHLIGAGTVSKAEIRQKSCTVETAGTSVKEKIDAGVENVLISVATPLNDTTPAAPEFSTTVRFNQVDVTNCDGADDKVRYCILSWYVDGVLVEKDLRFPLTEGSTATLESVTNYEGRVRPKKTVTVRLTYGDEVVTLSQEADQHMEQMTSPVGTIQVEATVLRRTSMYSYLDLSGWICNVEAGTKVIYENYAGRSAGKIRLPDGRSGWVRWSDLQISTKDYVQYTDYTRTQKENFVDIQGYESSSNLLVWISLRTQKVNVFQKTDNGWSLLHTFACCTGKNTTPTIGGVFRYQYRSNYWDFGSYIVKRPMIFNGGHAFHTRTYVKANGALLDPTIGRPASQGCIRMYDADVNWLWENMPFGTTVVVY